MFVLIIGTLVATQTSGKSIVQRTESSTVQQHIRYFYDPSQQEYSPASIKNGHYRQGIYNNSFAIFDHVARLNLKAQTIMALEDTHTAVGLSQVLNPARTGLWNYETGRLDENVFAMLASMGIPYINKETSPRLQGDQSGCSHKYQSGSLAREYEKMLVITRDHFNQLIVNRTGIPLETDLGTPVRLGGILPVSWRVITEGSINELFRFFSDISSHMITLARVREFYTNPHGLMREKSRMLKESRTLCPYSRFF
jgi:hypothetical protein